MGIQRLMFAADQVTITFYV